MNTAGCRIGWVKYANEPSQAALERSSQDAYAVWTVDDVARSIEFIKRILVYLFIFTLG